MSGSQSSSLLRTELGFGRRLALGWCGALARLGLSRFAIGLVFAIGVLPTGSNSRSEWESELLIQATEDSESSSRPGLNAQSPRRVRAGDGAAARDLDCPSAPLMLAPGRTEEAPRQSWQQPRRSIPPDDPDEALA